MPERPKRRKNNKNKRKNKTRSDQNQSASDVTEPCSSQSPSVKNIELNRNTENCEQSSENNDVNSPSITSVQNDTEIKSDNISKSVNTITSNDSVSDQDNIILDNINNSSSYSSNLDNKSDENVLHILDSSVINSINTKDQFKDKSPETLVIQNYVVESPDQSIKMKSKLGNSIKSKSLDNDDAPKIVEITEENMQSDDDNTLAVIDSSNVLVSDVESDVEWEKTENLCEHQSHESQEFATGKLSITTVPLDVAHTEQAKLLTPEEESSLREYLQTLNLTTQPPNITSVEIKTEIEHIINREIKHRLRKKGLADDFFSQKLVPPRTLDVIDEEGSSESSITSRRQSYLSDKKNDNDDLEDDVFEKKVNKEKFFEKSTNTIGNKNLGRLIPQQCVLVGAKIKDLEISEARGDWTVKNIEKMKGAELVYLTDSSSSTSSLHDTGEEVDDGVETDVSVRMITPTIEVTDTENLLTNTFIPKNEDNKVEEMKVDNAQSEINSQKTNEVYSNNPHEIVILSTDNIKTNLYVKDLDQSNLKELVKIDNTQIKEPEKVLSKDVNLQYRGNNYDIEMKVLKCELNDAINNLIKEVASDSENVNDNTKDTTFSRQDSSSSVSSSQSTAKYNPNYSSLNDVSNILREEIYESNEVSTKKTHNSTEIESHVKDVFDHVTEIPEQITLRNIQENIIDSKCPLTLRDLCVRKIATFPYGVKILEELASVSERLQNISVIGSNINKELNLSKLEHCKNTNTQNSKKTKSSNLDLMDTLYNEKLCLSTKNIDTAPPPVLPRNSSLKKSQDDHNWLSSPLPTKTEPTYVCLSPSQKMLMEKTNTVLTKEDSSQIEDVHEKVYDHKTDTEYCSREVQRENANIEPPAMSFKSQTGSRLLALIQDPVITSNINSSMNKQNNKSLEHLSRSNEDKGHNTKENFSKKCYDQLRSVRDLSSIFKPIPPPRPRKYSSSFYESDENSDFTNNSFRTMKSERKFFHFSTGNLNKEIENEVSSIQNLHRFFTNSRDRTSDQNAPRRPSLPKDLCEQQMEYIRQKEKEVDAEIRRLEEKKNNLVRQRRGPRAPLITDKEVTEDNFIDSNNYSVTRKRDATYGTKSPEKESFKSRLSSIFSSSQEEILRDKMYSEYVSQMAERQERKQQKIIKITNTPSTMDTKTISKSMSALDIIDSKVNNRIEKEFIAKARERWNKLGIKDPETEDEKDEKNKTFYREPKIIEHKIKVIEGGQEKDVRKLPTHLQDFVRFTAKEKEQETESPAVWRPSAPTPPPAPAPFASSPGAPFASSPGAPPPPPPPPVWTPNSAGPSPKTTRKTFRPVHFEETPPPRRKVGSSEQNGCTSGSENESRLRTSLSAPATGLNTLGTTTSRLPKAQNPTVTLLQKAREGQIPRGSNYLQQERDSARLPRDRASPPKEVNVLRREYASEGEAERSDHDRGGVRKMADGHRKVDGIGPTTKDGMPVALRSEVKDPSRWYKKMYDTIHKNKYDDDYVTVRYKSRRGQAPQRVTTNKSQYAYFDPRSGYLSEPEGGISRLGSSTWGDAYDSDVTAGARRRTASMQEDRRDDTTSPYLPNNKYSTLASARASQEVYKNQPGKIENYMPGKSSVVDQEAKQWWDEVMDIFDGQLSSTTSLPQASPKEKKDITSTILSKSNMARALKESGYESDSTLIFRRREDAEAPLSPAERRAAYRDLQAGGEPPLRGFRSPAPPRQESPRRYVESDVNIHYRCPVRHDPLPLVPERELARQQAEHMKRLYREQRRNKYLQELQDMQSRRHQDNFTPSQKTIVPLNRYDDAEKVLARALYAFNGQTARELSFRKGDLIHVRRQIDNNWYEGELHGRIGLFPYNYIEILKGDIIQSPKKPVVVEGRARAKFDFTAQTNLELPLKKGEVVVLTRRIDQNWWEGRNGNKTGIFPDSYVTVLQEPSQNKPEPQPILSTDKPVASPAAHGLINGDKRSMGSHSYTPQQNNPALANAPPATQPLPGYVAKPAQVILTASERGYGPPTGAGVDLNNTEPLYVDTNAEAVPYRAMYKYRPQNPDELELNEGDTVYVLEKCDDGWYVGSSQRTGRFGTFPGNYVERI